MSNIYPATVDTISEQTTGTSSMLDQILPIKEAIQGPSSAVCLDQLYSLVGEIRTLLKDNYLRERSFEQVTSTDLQGANGDMMRRHKVDTSSLEQYAGLLLKSPVLDRIREFVRLKVNSALFLAIFIEAARQRGDEVITKGGRRKIREGTHALSKLALPGDLHSKEFPESNHMFLLLNEMRNWLRLIGLLPQIDYDELHRRHMYRFTDAEDPSKVSNEVLMYRNGPNNTQRLIYGKKVLTIGSGRGQDERLFAMDENDGGGGAASVDMIEGSPYMVERLQALQLSLPKALRPKFRVPEAPQDMFVALREMATTGQKFDTIFAHSTLHYFDDATLRILLGLIRDCLEPEGHLTFAVKAPGAPLDGNGISLIKHEEEFGSSSGHLPQHVHVQNRMWLNTDGQTREFRDDRAWKVILEEFFEVKRSTTEVVDDYETLGVSQDFYYFTCKIKPRVATKKLSTANRMAPIMPPAERRTHR